MLNKSDEIKVLTAKDFASDQDVRWCPGCGDYSILAQVQRTFPELGIPRENFVVVSGIGCSSRFTYYMGTYGFHSIHGRATAIATGLKIARPELSVWVATGDGDLLSIGGNHFIHTCRKNIDINILLFNNRIYGLTKGQYSPTSEKGKITKSSPFGTVDYPFNPSLLALGSEASFIARTIDRYPKHLQETVKRAAEHKGTSFVEIYQNCNIFNDGAYDLLTSKDTKDDHVLNLEHGKPMVFGSKMNKGIRFDGCKMAVVNIDEGQFSVNDLFVHDELDRNPIRSFMITQMTDNPEFPTPIGIIRSIAKPTYDGGVEEQIKNVTEVKGKGTIKSLLNMGSTWEVE